MAIWEIMVNRPDSSSTRSDKSSSSRSSSMNRSIVNKGSFVRSKSGNDYNDKSATQSRLRNSSSLQSVAKSGGKFGMRKFKSNGRLVLLFVFFVNQSLFLSFEKCHDNYVWLEKEILRTNCHCCLSLFYKYL